MIGYAVAIVLLLLLMAAQAAFHFRDSIVTFWPVTRQAFERICDVAGCAIRPLRDAAMSYLSIESSDLQADPAHRGLLILTATVRNRATWPLAYPYLELTLTDAQDRIVVRRVLAPADYAGGTADLARGIPVCEPFEVLVLRITLRHIRIGHHERGLLVIPVHRAQQDRARKSHPGEYLPAGDRDIRFGRIVEGPAAIGRGVAVK